MDSPTPIDADLACIRCGYNLVGLPASGLCPECASPVQLSWLRPLPSGWTRGFVQRMGLGARLVQFGGVAFALLTCACLSPVARPLILLGPGAAMAAGCWLLTTRPPGPARPGLDRRLSRTLLLATVAAAALEIARPLGWAIAVERLGVPAPAPAVLGGAIALMGLGAYCAAVSHAVDAAAQLDPRLRDHGNGLIVMTVVLTVVAAIGLAAGAVALLGDDALLGLLAGIMVALGGVGWLVTHHLFFSAVAAAVRRRLAPREP